MFIKLLFISLELDFVIRSVKLTLNAIDVQIQEQCFPSFGLAPPIVKVCESRLKRKKWNADFAENLIHNIPTF